MSYNKFEFTKENIDLFLKDLAKEYRKHGGKNYPAELILIGGASVLINYGFRNMTTDIDAFINASTYIKDAINKVGDRFHLPYGWLNSDFQHTDSYTPKIIEYSKYYKTYSNVLTIRTISAEYLIAMKLKAGRQYKSDLSDVLGILAEHEKNGKPISLQAIKKAVINLYGDWQELSESSRNFINNIFLQGNFNQLYSQIKQGENETKEMLIKFQKDHPKAIKESNVNPIARELQSKSNRASVLAKLQTMNKTQIDKDNNQRSINNKGSR